MTYNLVRSKFAGATFFYTFNIYLQKRVKIGWQRFWFGVKNDQLSNKGGAKVRGEAIFFKFDNVAF
jgi:hypothetical protein